MNHIETVILDNGIKLIIKHNPNTPRFAVNVFASAGTKYESKAGLANIVGKLLLQGTKNRNGEELATELDLNAIDMSIDTRQDYTKIKTVALNEDFDKALDLLADILINSTFNDFEKEIRKFKGELEVELESPKTRASDNLIKNMYLNHPYGHTHTQILKDLPEITFESIKNFFEQHFNASGMVISVVGAVDKKSIVKVFNDKFSDIAPANKIISTKAPEGIKESKTVTIEKEDAAQAQIIKGWIVPDIASEDYAPLILLNIILGSSGLSSRLFVELRDKKGLAYHVRSSFESLKDSGIFTVYIGTAPNNINTCLDGFNTEIKKLQDELVSEKELEDAKNNYLGKRAFFHETNAQQAHYIGYFEAMGLGADYDMVIPEKINKVTSNDVKRVANKYLSSNNIISVLAPKKYLSQIK